VCSALRAEAVIRSAEGTRTVPVRELHVGPYETVVGEREILMDVRVPIRTGIGSAYEKVERRAGDWPVAAVGVFVQVDGDTMADVGIGMTAVGAPHFACPEAEDLLRGERADADTFAAAGEVCARSCNPQSDQRGPEDYKRHLVGVLAVRALHRASVRARRGEAA
jgi:carbon-monoxide dehydrogenase medium subunit